MNLPFFIARRYLFSKKSHNAINIITLISVFCVAVVTISLVIILSGLNGLTNLVESRYSSFNTDIQVSPRLGKTFEMDSLKKREIQKINGIAYYSEVLEENALLNYEDRQIIATLKGVGPDFVAMTHFDTLMRWGVFKLGADSIPYSVIGRGLEQRLDIPNENNFTPIRVFVPRKGADLNLNPTSIEQPFNKKSIMVAGAFTIADDFDYKYMIVSIGFARKLLGEGKASSALEIALRPGADKNKIQQQISSIMGSAFVVKNRYQQNELLFKTLQSEKLWTSMILIFVLVIATFNIIGSLTMLIIEKQKDIGTLSSMGADVGLIRNIFFTEGLMISFLGSITGLVLGVVICLLQMKYGLVRFGEGKMVVDAYPVAIEVGDLLAILAFVMVIGFVAAWYPVRIFTRKHIRTAS
ncbi:MAG TPA: FtsX-like permease family protein [Bacteroidia bacterium]|jgi:ABC-type lipoprotein release transport system permease subunit|nr:FtsX-like permease family protein [Bacteroidia bacterium]